MLKIDVIEFSKKKMHRKKVFLFDFHEKIWQIEFVF